MLTPACVPRALRRYKRTGMVLWPDYWAPSVAPDLYRIAPEASPPSGTVESGQMVINKRRCWRALLLTLFMNCQGSLYYNLLTNYMGVGDKETFPMAMRMLQQVRARCAARPHARGCTHAPLHAASRRF